MVSMNTHILIHYAELALKGQNRPFFQKSLVRNLKNLTAGLGLREIQQPYGRLVLVLEPDANLAELEKRLRHAFGISNFSFAHEVAGDLEQLKAAITRCLEGRRFASFAVRVKRPDKTFPMNSMQIAAVLGRHVQEVSGKPVNLTGPELEIGIEVLPHRFLVHFGKIQGPGGLPVGAGGKVLVMLSGGIDSPVAAYMMARRGCLPHFVHFHAFPFGDHRSRDKAIGLAEMLSFHQFRTRLFIIPFGKIQEQIVRNIPPQYSVIMYRRMMVRIACALARKNRIPALVSGESLGQVASQTLHNLAVVDQVADLPLLRPLVGHNKTEIIHIAQEIGTYPTSILPFEDCCTLFIPKHPVTRSHPQRVEALEAALEVDQLVEAGLSQVEQVDLPRPLNRKPTNFV